MLEALAHPGWTMIVEDLSEAFEQQDHLLLIPDAEALGKAQGRLVTLFQIINLQDNLRGELNQLEDPDEDEEFSLESDQTSEDFVRNMNL
jgi:hypothetical protein